jgi:hypothetical protein
VLVPIGSVAEQNQHARLKKRCHLIESLLSAMKRNILTVSIPKIERAARTRAWTIPAP